MNGVKRFASAILALALIACFLPAKAEDVLEIRGASEYVPAGKKGKLEAYANGKLVPVLWNSSNLKGASVSAEGIVRTNDVSEPQEVIITATGEGNESGSLKITVVPNAKSVQMYYGGKMCATQTLNVDVTGGEAALQLECLVKPQNAGLGLTWTSSNEEVATVDAGGCVRAFASGVTTITVTSLNGRYSTCQIRASHTVNAISIACPAELAAGQSVRPEVTIEPAAAAGEPVYWKTSDASVLKVDAKGNVTALKPGTAKIACGAENGVYAVAQIEVYAPVSAVKLSPSDIKLPVGASAALTAEIRPQSAKYPALTFSSENPSVATVDESGVVTGVSDGETRIIATAMGGAQASARVAVKFIPLQSAAFRSQRKALGVGETYACPINFTPENASSRDVAFESDRPDIAYVDARGVVTAVSVGTATITVRPAAAGAATGEMRVRVIESGAKPLTGITIGINPGHQTGNNYQKLPIAPGSDIMGNANNGGAVGVKTRNREYQVNLEIALKLRDILWDMGAEVVMTRTENDVNISNVDRAKMLNEAQVDVAVQIHCNNNDTNNTSSGMSAFVKSKDPESYAIAQLVLNATCASAGANNLNVRKYDRYMSLNWSTTPAFLIECGYMSTPEEDVKLGTPEYQAKIAQGIADGLCEYYAGDAQ